MFGVLGTLIIEFSIPEKSIFILKKIAKFILIIISLCYLQKSNTPSFLTKMSPYANVTIKPCTIFTFNLL